ncbi:hypothetical protein IE4872_PA00093 (plasmid) [Rhizobium gallicum]|uniref:Uncharacterized protein n=1 Tax=Rhizobium gallicum TaxID=56730 RepID=A0A1L5NPT2_9HYPH|nr:hypothetical protein IE4872_PA00093 [Rhizobium gallicum]
MTGGPECRASTMLIGMLSILQGQLGARRIPGDGAAKCEPVYDESAGSEHSLASLASDGVNCVGA